jgi:hypothetical protein
MKTLTRSIAVLFLLAASLLAQAQNMAGQWQGVLQAGKDLRIVVVITSADGLKATMYSIDQTPQGIPANAITVQGTTLRMSFGGIGVRFEGTVSADGNSVTGTFTQGNNPLPMTLARTNPDTAWKIPEPPKAMAADAKAVFEVATIKPSNPAAQGKLLTIKGRQVLTINTGLSDLISFSYGLTCGR